MATASASNAPPKILHVEGDLAKLVASEERRKTRYSGATLPQDSSSDFYLTVQLFAEGKPLCPAITTSFGTLNTHIQYSWNQKLTFPIKYHSLPIGAQLVFTIWDTVEPGVVVPAGGTTVRLFGPHRTLRKGRQKLYIWEGRAGDGNVETTTPGKMKNTTEIDRIEKLIKKYDRKQIEHVEWLDRMAFRAIEKINAQTDNEIITKLALFIAFPDLEHPVVFHQKIQNKKMSEVVGKEIVTVFDPELVRDNAVEEKHSMLIRAIKRRPAIGVGSDRELKPNAEERHQIRAIIHYPPTQKLDDKEKEMVWKFRYYLVNIKKAFTKFVKSVDWSHPYERSEGQQLIQRWEPIDVDDALELLTVHYAHVPEIRQYAVKRLEAQPDEELQYYLLQLVQALRYDQATGHTELASFLIRRASANAVIGNYFYWYIKVAADDANMIEYYQTITKQYLAALGKTTSKDSMRQHFQRQEEVVGHWVKLCQWLRASNLVRAKKIEKVRDMIASNSEFSVLSSFKALPLPLDPTIRMSGVKPNDVYVFNSKLEPVRLSLENINKLPVTIIFKMGDDVRQDQLIVQMISLMDRLLKKENLDLKLSPYKVLATSKDTGMIECVPNSKNIADVLAEYDKDLRKYIKHHNPDPHADYGIKPAALNNFVRSSAGYCVITYILGIGDRHLDNLLLTHDGKLFHIDFGFILGKDPKPFPPPMKLCQEMVEGMGGKDSIYYNQFRTYCCEAFNILRKSSDLILNLFTLMIDANIPHVNQAEKSVYKVQEKLKLDLTDEQASAYFQGMINESVRALAPQIAETMHRWAKYWRS